MKKYEFINREVSSVLAKSEPKTTLRQHIDDGLNIYTQFQEILPRISVKYDVTFWTVLRASVILHDTGKSHIEFQKLLMGKNNKWYHQRHELFSVYFALNSDCADVLRACRRIDFDFCGIVRHS